MTDEDQGGRVFFSSTGRTLEGEDEICLLTVGVDIGSSTSHLVFSRIVLERLDSRYVVSERETFYGSDILLTPYSEGETIDAEALGAFIKQGIYRRQGRSGRDRHRRADPHRRRGAPQQRARDRRTVRAAGRQAGRGQSAGDSLETIMAAYGSGAVARSIRDEMTVMNVDVGGGTSKIAVCAEGKVTDLAALDVGARLHLPRAGRQDPARRGGRSAFRRGTRHRRDRRRHADARSGPRHRQPDGGPAVRGDGGRRAGRARRTACCAPIRSPIAERSARIQFSGGVSEFIYGTETKKFGDLGPLLAAEIRARVETFCSNLEQPLEGIRATVVGASQYTIQLSGSTIYVSPLDALPLRNVPVIAPALPLDGEVIDSAAVARAIQTMLKRLDLAGGETPVALFVPWRGSATFQRLDAFCRGVVEGLRDGLARNQPLILAGDGDVGGLIGIHLREEMKIANAIVSIDGLELKEFDYIDIGAMLDASGAVPVVIKSLIFPGADTARS